MTDVTSKNANPSKTIVYSKPLYQHSKNPPTGYKRDGYCRSGQDDPGNHSVAGTITEQFLDFTATQGNDLRKQVGLQPGQKWCLCASRWKQAFDARESNEDPKVPSVSLHATDLRALEEVSFKDLKAFAADGEGSHAGRAAAIPTTHPGSYVKESKEIGGKEPKA
ncbi:MAG: hypothetical protein M1831_003797 [Alyxoria varia]|nr:MAG: hypothetical protein M1831_003797 [Alyxoria varia]